jgi:hypothetical protein
MRYFLILLFLSSNLIASAQKRAEEILLSSKSPKLDLLDSLSASLLTESNPKAVLLWHRYYNIQNEDTKAAQWMLSSSENLIIDSSKALPFLNWNTVLKSIKKPKMKLQALDSLLNLRPDNPDQMVQRIIAISEIKGLLGKKRKDIIAEYAQVPEDIQNSGYNELRFRYALNYLYKSLKANTELKSNIVAINIIKGEFDANYEKYSTDLLTMIAAKIEQNKTSPAAVTSAPVGEGNKNETTYIVAFLCLLLLLVALTIVVFNLKRRNKKTTNQGMEDFLQKEQQWNEKETLYLQQLDDLKIKIANSNAENDKLKLYYNSNQQIIKESKEQLEELQAIVKEQIDEVVKEPGVAQVMNLKNGLTRGLMKLRDSLGK